MAALWTRPRLRDVRTVPTVPVEVDWSHPLALSTAYVPALGLIDLGGVLPPVVAGSAATFGQGSAGLGLLSNVANAGAWVTTGNYLGGIGNDFTLVWFGDILGASIGFGAALIGIQYDTSGNAPYWCTGIALNNAFQMDINVNGTLSETKVSTGFVAEPRATIVATFSIGSEAQLYHDGALIGSATLAAGTISTSANSLLTLGAYLSPAATSQSNTLSYLAGIAQRAWSAEEVAQFSAEPFAMLRPRG